MTEAKALYGTDALVAPAERLTSGALSFTLEQGAIRHIRVGDVKMFLSRTAKIAFLSVI